jgi:hypothetical protein
MTTKPGQPLTYVLGIYVVTIVLREDVSIVMNLIADNKADAEAITKLYVRSLQAGVKFEVARSGEKLVSIAQRNEAVTAAERARRSLTDRV